ncbi:hypothetical protein B0G81_2376 [Paraburkholderia sp. BL6665CI2N2]|nr:hypothetical protein B0G81_2376 [Paraburkholderia sp. BL6665CI2N2]
MCHQRRTRQVERTFRLPFLWRWFKFDHDVLEHLDCLLIGFQWSCRLSKGEAGIALGELLGSLHLLDMFNRQQIFSEFNTVREHPCNEELTIRVGACRLNSSSGYGHRSTSERQTFHVSSVRTHANFNLKLLRSVVNLRRWDIR